MLDKIVTSDESGRSRIVDQPPLMEHVSSATDERVEMLVSRYRQTLRPDVALLLSQFTLRDYVLRVVGVGSVGTRGLPHRVRAAHPPGELGPFPRLDPCRRAPNGRTYDYFVRQFRDMKGSVEQVEADFAAVERAVEAGRLPIKRGA